MAESLKEDVNDLILDEIVGANLKPAEQKFILYYLESYNILQSYMKAFPDTRKEYACSFAYKLLKRKDIQNAIKKVKKIMAVSYDIDPSRYVEFLLKGANADIGDYLSFSEEEVEMRGKDGEVLIDMETGKPLTKKVSKVRFKSSDNVSTDLIQRVKQGRDGISIELVDKVKCWEKLKEFMEWKMAKEDEDKAGTNIIEAINASANKVWEENPDKDLEETLKDGK